MLQKLFALPADIALGLMILAACPGGVLSNAASDGVRRAFLCMFIRGLQCLMELRNPNLPPKPRMNNLHSFDI